MMGTSTKETPWANAPSNGGRRWIDSEPILPFLQRINLFGHFHIATRRSSIYPVDAVEKRNKSLGSLTRGSESRSVQSLKQFWNSQILSRGSRSEEEICHSAGDLVGLKSATFRPRDNFNKYKTASTVQQQQKRQTIDTAYLARPSIAFVKSGTEGSDQRKFPQGSTLGAGAKIHWARREDIFEARRGKMNTPKASNTTTIIIGGGEVGAGGACESDKENNLASVGAEREASAGDKKDKAECRSNNSLSGSSVSLATTVESSPRRGIACRKVSFKTHSGQSHHIRKMAMGGSKVAALTHRFNQLIQQDTGILEEVKKKGVVVHRVAGHVYKIREEGGEKVSSRKGSVRLSENVSEEKSPRKVPSTRRKPSVNRKGSSSGSRLSSRIETTPSGSVRATIKLFEPPSRSDAVQLRDEGVRPSAKPKVPDKSEQVLLRTREIQRKRLKLSSGDKVSDVIDEQVPKDANRGAVMRKIDALDEIEEAIEEKSAMNHVDETNLTVEDGKSENVHDDVPEKVDGAVLGDDYAAPPSPEKFPHQQTPVTKSDLAAMATLPKSSRNKEKSVYGRIYEKIKFKSSFLYAKKTREQQPLSTSHGNLMVNSDMEKNPDQKIVEALCRVNEKIEHLSKSTTDLPTFTLPADSSTDLPEIKPNDSFLFRTTSKNSFGDLMMDPLTEEESVEAINHHLINRTQSMDESIFPQHPGTPNQSTPIAEVHFQSLLQETDDLIRKMNTAYGNPDKTEDDYEIINPPVDSEADQPKEALYQTLAEVRSGCESVNSYESFDNYEAIDELRKEVSAMDSGYEVCSPPEPPPPRKPEDHQKKSQEPPVPMRNAFVGTTENIYDTIKNGGDSTPSTLNGYERLAGSVNCYESINSNNRHDFLRLNHLHMLRHSDSVSTLSSDHKTNSLYGTSLNGHPLRQPPSEGSSENSDEWIDISDSEEVTKHNFIV